ncbi:cytochrome c oxidase assembly protein [Planotetraspora kaengkrachanensis]|uniref:Copper resistance protein D domain-containing protein n=1 Tax=Planotetraspora kaengkrachanensis TaxID=575193 RepID=A0A8J3PY16_9ACTN|nr:cytochrome c oxidase assembly protein [Planotetraspora kaengkrachanensis]GIG82986.1 hypothetical protein Pka01_61130 [Planotetraspora kaengkrachanensis]
MVTWTLPLVRLAHDVCAMATVGALFTGTVLVPTSAGELSPAATRCIRAAGTWALGWAVSTAFVVVLTASDVSGVPLSKIGSVAAVADLTLSITQGRTFLIVALIALVIGAVCRNVSRTGWARALLAASVFGLVPPAFAGHATSAVDHDLAVSAMMVHIVAVAVWMGGLVGVLLYLRNERELLPSSISRFSRVALTCFIAVALSGAVAGWLRLGEPSQLWTSRYGLLLGGKILALFVLGYVGWRHRRTTMAGLASGQSKRPFFRLAAGEVAVMGATIGLAVALSRTAPPAVSPVTATNVQSGELLYLRHLLGYEVLPFTFTRLITEWRPNPFLISLFLAAAAAYSVGVRRVTMRGIAWPRRRTWAWFTGLGMLALVEVTGIGTYARVMFSLHSVQHVVITVLGPVLLAGGAPVTLTLQALGRPADVLSNRFARWATKPIVGFLAYVIPVFSFYATDWFGYSQSSQAVNLATQLTFTATGLLYFWVAAGIDPLPVPLGSATRARLVLGGVAVQTVLVTVLLTWPLIGEQWYRQLGLMYRPLQQDPVLGSPTGGLIAELNSLAIDQHIGGAVRGVIAIGALYVLLFLSRARSAKPGPGECG